MCVCELSGFHFEDRRMMLFESLITATSYKIDIQYRLHICLLMHSWIENHAFTNRKVILTVHFQDSITHNTVNVSH